MDSTPDSAASPKLFPSLLARLAALNYSPRTQAAYVQWIKRYILFHHKRHPRDMAASEVTAFLSYLATEKKVAASTQNQAASAIQFLYAEVLAQSLPVLKNVTKVVAKSALPVILAKHEVQAILLRLDGRLWLMASLMYGSGLRVTECLRLRVSDLDFHRQEILVRDPQGYKHHTTLLPASLVAPLTAHLHAMQALHAQDLHKGLGETLLPPALLHKIPAAGKEWAWQYVFPASKLSVKQQTGQVYRHHADEKPIQRAFKKAANQSGILKEVGPNALRHSFATHLLESGQEIQTVQRLMGHADESVTRAYTQLMNTAGQGIASPLDILSPKALE